MDAVTRQNALIAWVKGATGLDDGHVFMSDQKVQRPADTYIDVKLFHDRPNNCFIDELKHDYDTGRPVGQQVQYTVTGHRQVLVQVHVYGAPVNDTNANTSAMTLAVKCQLSLRLPTVMAALDVAGLAIVDVGQIQNLAALVNTAFEGRCVLECMFNYADKVTATGTYIEHVNLTNETTGDEISV